MSMIAPNKNEIILNKTKFQIRFFFASSFSGLQSAKPKQRIQNQRRLQAVHLILRVTQPWRLWSFQPTDCGYRTPNEGKVNTNLKCLGRNKVSMYPMKSEMLQLINRQERIVLDRALLDRTKHFGHGSKCEIQYSYVVFGLSKPKTTDTQWLNP